MDGAISYSITFDPSTKTEPNHDYVRFLKVLNVLFYSCISSVQSFHGGVASAVPTCRLPSDESASTRGCKYVAVGPANFFSWWNVADVTLFFVA